MPLLRSGHMSARFAPGAHPVRFKQGRRPITMRPRASVETLVVEPLVLRQQLAKVAKLSQQDGSLAAEQRHCHRVYMTVRPTEVDMYGVVDHTVYSEYLYTARVTFSDEALASIGYSVESMLQQNVTFATVNVHVSFSGPLRRGEKFYAESVLCEVKGASLKFEERVVRLPTAPGEQEQLVCKADVRVAALAADSYKPARMPADVKEAFQRHCSATCAHTRACH